MKNEIERKFFVRQLPSLVEIEPVHYERYILSNDDGKEVRIQKTNNSYSYEEKNEISVLERSRSKKEITKEEFEILVSKSYKKPIIRDRYAISTNPNTAIQIYHGDFEGLIRAEIEFETEEEAKAFTPPTWMGAEMTGLPIARDASLLDLSREEFKDYLENNF